MTKMIILAAGLTMFALAFGSWLDGDALARCQQTHSFDTCFHSLNR